ncbi:GFA family protein [uncultured Paracoccus sp.]|uniref:GFA family protein n=1 Tax=uncultured Paracoccus sp. TaxID=189685 RepID=UPI002630BCBA|nr:GFA family protein [uncultured Paracoccus sp.]
MIAGACLCGAVRFSGTADSPEVTACHCGMCRRWTGHVNAAFHMDAPRIEGEVRWFRSSDRAERGFCPVCGSSLFWREPGEAGMAVAAGAVSNPTGLRLVGHIHVEGKGDYYQVADGLPQRGRE